MKLVDRKTRKAIKKSVRKAMRKHGPALMASLATGLAASIATLAKTDVAGKPGKSNLADIAERVKNALTEDGGNKSRSHESEKKREVNAIDRTGQPHAAVT